MTRAFAQSLFFILLSLALITSIPSFRVLLPVLPIALMNILRMKDRLSAPVAIAGLSLFYAGITHEFVLATTLSAVALVSQFLLAENKRNLYRSLATIATIMLVVSYVVQSGLRSTVTTASIFFIQLSLTFIVVYVIQQNGIKRRA